MKVGLQTGDNNRFLRLWFELDYNKITFNSHDGSDVSWVPHNKAGDFRKWYGNGAYVVNWSNNGSSIKACSGSRPQNLSYYFRAGFSWSDVSSGAMSVRYWPSGCIFDTCAPTMFPFDESYYLLGLLNTPIGQSIMDIMSPTIHYTAGSMMKFPVWESHDSIDEIENLVKENIALAREDWDVQETSWDFKAHPLMKKEGTLAERWKSYNQDCERRFYLTKLNEEKINHYFLDLYGLTESLPAEVEDDRITIYRGNLEEDIKALISYAVGCLFGRYSLDADGVIFTGGEWTDSKYSSFIPDKDNCIPITDEPYFEDDIVGLFCSWLKKVYGEDTLEENLDFIAKALGNKGTTSREVIRNYFLTDFIKDHIKTYQKRPIYWLFDSGKQNGFKALVYMHRWNADTVGNLRVEYLHKMQHTYEREIIRMQENIDNSRDSREVSKASKRKDKLQKQLKETKDYDAKLAHIALSRIDIDLDDGVKVNYEKVQTGRDGKKMQILAKI